MLGDAAAAGGTNSADAVVVAALIDICSVMVFTVFDSAATCIWVKGAEEIKESCVVVTKATTQRLMPVSSFLTKHKRTTS